MATARSIREDLATLLTDAGYNESAYDYERLGLDKGSRVHQSFATIADRRDYTRRPGMACGLVVIGVTLRVLLQRQRDDQSTSGYVIDDQIDYLVNALEGWTGTDYATAVDSAEHAPHDRVSAFEVVTVTMTVRCHQYRA